MGVLERHYPERMAAALVVNPPPFFAALWRVVRPLLDPRTARKIRVLPSRREALAALRELMEEEHIPTAYSGGATQERQVGGGVRRPGPGARRPFASPKCAALVGFTRVYTKHKYKLLARGTNPSGGWVAGEHIDCARGCKRRLHPPWHPSPSTHGSLTAPRRPPPRARARPRPRPPRPPAPPWRPPARAPRARRPPRRRTRRGGGCARRRRG